MHQSRSVRLWISLLAAVAAIGSARLARAQAPQSLVYAVYDDEKAAQEAFSAMRNAQRQGAIHVDSFAVISKDQNGRVRVSSTQRRGARTGAIVGAVVGMLGGPVGVAAGAAAGGGLGYLTGRTVGIPRSTINDIKSSLTPGSSAIVAVVQQRWVADLESSLRAAKARQVLDSKLANPTDTGEAPSDTGTRETPEQPTQPESP
jgi:uncharacterized membrane protein